MYGIGHVLSKIDFCETPKRSMQQSFKVGYTINLDTPFKFHRTVLPCSQGLRGVMTDNVPKQFIVLLMVVALELPNKNESNKTIV